MSKKKLVELLQKDFEQDHCLDTNYFQTEEGDQRTSKMVKLYDRSLVIYSVHDLLMKNSGKVEPWGRINFDFDLIF
jgi:hypothetical protein